MTAYDCTIDPEKPNEPGNKLVAKARFQCPTAMNGRALRTELQQRRADGDWYTVPKSIVVRRVPEVYTGQWYGAGSDEVSCKQVSGTRKFRSVVMITDGAGNVVQTASNPEEYNRDCVDSGAGERVGLVFGSNLIDDCAIATEVLTDPNAEFTDLEVLASEGNFQPCGEDGVVETSMITNRADADWSLAVEGIEAGLPSARVGADTEVADVIALPEDDSEALAAISAKEDEIANLFLPEDGTAEDQRLSELSTEQVGPCQDGSIGDRASTVLRKRNKGFGNILLFSMIKYKRITCAIWQITDVETFLKRGTRPVRLNSADYTMARDPGSIDYPIFRAFHRERHDYDCQLMQIGEHFGWSDADKWEILPNQRFTVGGQIESLSPILYDPWCVTQGGVHLVGRQRLRGAAR